MKYFVRSFFRILRVFLGPLMLLWEFFSRPKGLVRPAASQQQIDQQCRDITLYQYRTCPFCIKVRKEMRRLSLSVEHRNVSKTGANRADLVRGGGLAKVPCLKIVDQTGASRWLYDSGEIISFLRGRFPLAEPSAGAAVSR